jgi:uncharacterized beta-barrel protein YwiB (DUF1934 family)
MKVTIRLRSAVTSDGETGQTDQTVDGFLRTFDDYTELSYREPSGDEGLGNTLTTVRFYRDTLELIRRGDYTCVLTIVVGIDRECLYQTPFGALPLTTNASRYHAALSASGGQADVCYTLKAGSDCSSHRLTFTVTPVA